MYRTLVCSSHHPLLGSFISATLSCVVKKKESSFCTISSPSTLWTTSASPACSPPSVSPQQRLSAAAQMTDAVSSCCSRETHTAVQGDRRWEAPPSPLRKEGCAPAAGRQPSAVSPPGRASPKPPAFAQAILLPGPVADRRLSQASPRHELHRSPSSLSAEPAFFPRR